MKNTIKRIALILVATIISLTVMSASADEIAETIEKVTEIETVEEVAETETIEEVAETETIEEVTETETIEEVTETETIEEIAEIEETTETEETIEEVIEVANVTVTIRSNRGANVTMNQIITLTSTLEGAESFSTIAYQWQCDMGNGFENIAGATSSTYSYAATLETLSFSYRLVVTLD